MFNHLKKICDILVELSKPTKLDFAMRLYFAIALIILTVASSCNHPNQIERDRFKTMSELKKEESNVGNGGTNSRPQHPTKVENAKAVCAIIPRSYLALKRGPDSSAYYVIKRREYEKLRERRFVRENCHNDYAAISRMDRSIGNMIHNPSLAVGTGFLLKENIVLTAAHCLKVPSYPQGQCCINDMSCPNQTESLAFVFGFEDTSWGQYQLRFEENEVYFGKLIRGRCTGVADWAAVRLDRAVDDQIGKPVQKLDVTGSADLAKIDYYLFGHPLGVPKTYNGNGTYLYPGPSSDEPYFIDIKSLNGNSGSPVFDSKDGTVVGMIVGGDEKLPGEERTMEVWNYGRGCLNYDPTVIRGERVQRIKPICDVLPKLCGAPESVAALRRYKRQFQPRKSRKLEPLEDVTLLPHVYHYVIGSQHHVSVIVPDLSHEYQFLRATLSSADEDGHKFLDLTFRENAASRVRYHPIPIQPFQLLEGQSLIVRTLKPAEEVTGLFVEMGRRVVHKYQYDSPTSSQLDSLSSLPHLYAAKYEDNYYINVLQRIDDGDYQLEIQDVAQLTQPFHRQLGEKDTTDFRTLWYMQTSGLNHLMDMDVVQYYPGVGSGGEPLARGKGTIRYGDADEKPDLDKLQESLDKFIVNK